jgi:hypothetical protein
VRSDAGIMQVYLIPVGGNHHELYVEVPDEPEADVAAEAPRGPVGRLMHRFKVMLKEAEAERLRQERGEEQSGSGLFRTIWRTIMRKIAEAIAEQRLLWHLRHQTVVELRHPQDLDGPAALAEVRTQFSHDASKHLRWLVIDGLLVAITGPLFFFVPGPNIVSWYFTFRAVGHYLSWRGARKGLTAIEWRPEASAPLTSVRFAIALPAADRRHRLEEISAALGLKHLTGFVERVATRAS